jgi:hypothetical protein
MVEDQIDQGEAAHGAPDYESFQRSCAIDNVSIESRDESEENDPRGAISSAELLAKGFGAIGFE